MDRLRNAIAEARQNREALLARTAAAVPDTPAPAKDPWDRLPIFVPDPAVLARNLVVTRDGGADAAPFDMLRTRVVQEMSRNGWTRLALTSPDPSCGKSTVVANLAFSLARLTELRIVVLDLDLRRPALANLLGFKGDHSVARVLQDEAALTDQMVRVASNLAFATTARPVCNPSELLQGAGADRLLNRIRDDYAPDMVLFDLPPLLVGDDTMAFLPSADCALMVAAANQSVLGQVDAGEREIAARTNMLGVVVNRCADPGPAQGYAYGAA